MVLRRLDVPPSAFLILIDVIHKCICLSVVSAPIGPRSSPCTSKMDALGISDGVNTTNGGDRHAPPSSVGPQTHFILIISRSRQQRAPALHKSEFPQVSLCYLQTQARDFTPYDSPQAPQKVEVRQHAPP